MAYEQGRGLMCGLHTEQPKSHDLNINQKNAKRKRSKVGWELYLELSAQSGLVWE
jgi:hypothetical protein